MRTHNFIQKRLLFGFLAIAAVLLIAGVFGACSKGSKASVRLIVTYAGNGSQWERDGKLRALKRGMALGPSDVVVTGRAGAVDLQSPAGATIRIQPFSRVRISDLTSQKSSLDLKQGALMAKVNRQDASQEFEVRTPTLVAGVRGTTFRVEESGVKVLSGKVAVRPRIRALEGKSSQEIESDPLLKEVSQKVASEERILTPGQRADIPETKAADLESLNGTASGKAEESAVLKDTLQGKLLLVKEEGIDLKDKADAATLVRVDEEVLSELAMADTKAKDPNWMNPRIEKLAANYNQKRDAALDAFEKENTKTISLTTEEAIRKEYDVVEYVHLLQSNKVYVGAVLTQAGGILVIQTKDGFQRVPIAKVNYIDYK